MSAQVNPSIVISLKVLHLLVYLLVAGNIHLEVAVHVFPLVLEETELLFELLGMTLGKAQSREGMLKLPECSVDIVGLAQLVNDVLGGSSPW